MLVNSTYQTKGPRQKVTPDITGAATVSYGNAITTGNNITVSLDADINTKISVEVTLKLGVSYTKSSSSNQPFGMTFDVPAGKTGAIYFTPFIYVGNCTYVNEVGVGTSTQVSFPKVVNGFTDGLSELVTK